jgi:glycosyltransferase involved in cell wall biosynthesis
MLASMPAPLVSVIMPTWGHGHFIARALESLRAQTLADWELLVVDDASPDDTRAIVAPYRQDPRIRYQRLRRNSGLGAALNRGLEAARGAYIAYLPSDDVYYADHLRSLLDALAAHPLAVLAHSGLRHHYNRFVPGVLEEHGLQLVQVLHRAAPERWVEREELVTDDLARMFWDRLRTRGAFVGTSRLTCEWVDHPDQLHKVIREPVGGINRFRQRFGVRHPLRFHTRTGNRIDEVEQYLRYRTQPRPPRARDALRILLVGELAYNADRILALDELGHRLYGLWTPQPYWYNTVGPLPFGHVEDIPLANWEREVKRLAPDVIYALLNWQAVPFAHEVLERNPGVPFVWHFKEGPFICLEKGTWRELVALYRRSDGRVYSSPEMRDWMESAVPGLAGRPSLVLDGDLPKRDWFGEDRSPRLSERDGELHTVVPGRPIGLHPQDVGALADEGIHLHFHGDFTHGQWREWIAKTLPLAPRHLHLHPQVDPAGWVREFSRYDAGWLHVFESENRGELRRANWDDLNYPARIPTLLAAGLPLLQRDNARSIVAAGTLARRLDIGIEFTGMADLRQRLSDAALMARLRENAWAARGQFTFDYHAPRLVEFFRAVATRRLAHPPVPAAAPA